MNESLLELDLPPLPANWKNILYQDVCLENIPRREEPIEVEEEEIELSSEDGSEIATPSEFENMFDSKAEASEDVDLDASEGVEDGENLSEDEEFSRLINSIFRSIAGLKYVLCDSEDDGIDTDSMLMVLAQVKENFESLICVNLIQKTFGDGLKTEELPEDDTATSEKINSIRKYYEDVKEAPKGDEHSQFQKYFNLIFKTIDSIDNAICEPTGDEIDPNSMQLILKELKAKFGSSIQKYLIQKVTESVEDVPRGVTNLKVSSEELRKFYEDGKRGAALADDLISASCPESIEDVEPFVEHSRVRVLGVHEVKLDFFEDVPDAPDYLFKIDDFWVDQDSDDVSTDPEETMDSCRDSGNVRRDSRDIEASKKAPEDATESEVLPEGSDGVDSRVRVLGVHKAKLDSFEDVPEAPEGDEAPESSEKPNDLSIDSRSFSERSEESSGSSDDVESPEDVEPLVEQPKWDENNLKCTGDDSTVRVLSVHKVKLDFFVDIPDAPEYLFHYDEDFWIDQDSDDVSTDPEETMDSCRASNDVRRDSKDIEASKTAPEDATASEMLPEGSADVTRDSEDITATELPTEDATASELLPEGSEDVIKVSEDITASESAPESPEDVNIASLIIQIPPETNYVPTERNVLEESLPEYIVHMRALLVDETHQFLVSMLILQSQNASKNALIPIGNSWNPSFDELRRCEVPYHFSDANVPSRICLQFVDFYARVVHFKAQVLILQCQSAAGNSKMPLAEVQNQRVWESEDVVSMGRLLALDMGDLMVPESIQRLQVHISEQIAQFKADFLVVYCQLSSKNARLPLETVQNPEWKMTTLNVTKLLQALDFGRIVPDVIRNQLESLIDQCQVYIYRQFVLSCQKASEAITMVLDWPEELEEDFRDSTLMSTFTSIEELLLEDPVEDSEGFLMESRELNRAYNEHTTNHTTNFEKPEVFKTRVDSEKTLVRVVLHRRRL